MTRLLPGVIIGISSTACVTYLILGQSINTQVIYDPFFLLSSLRVVRQVIYSSWLCEVNLSWLLCLMKLKIKMLSSGNLFAILGAGVSHGVLKLERISESSSSFHRSSLRPREVECFAMVTKKNREPKLEKRLSCLLSPCAFHIPHQDESLGKNFTITRNIGEAVLSFTSLPTSW